MAWHLTKALPEINDGSETDMVENFLLLVFTRQNKEKLVQ